MSIILGLIGFVLCLTSAIFEFFVQKRRDGSPFVMLIFACVGLLALILGLIQRDEEMKESQKEIKTVSTSVIVSVDTVITAKENSRDTTYVISYVED